MKTTRIYGMMAEFDSASDLVAAARKTHEAGYRKIDAYSPFPIEELAEAIGFHKNRVPLVALIGGIIGGLRGYLMQYWMNVDSYPREHRRQALSLLAGVHRRDLRDDDSVRRNFRRARHAGAERPADAVSPGVQRPALRPGHRRIVSS